MKKTKEQIEYQQKKKRELFDKLEQADNPRAELHFEYKRLVKSMIKHAIQQFILDMHKNKVVTEKEFDKWIDKFMEDNFIPTD